MTIFVILVIIGIIVALRIKSNKRDNELRRQAKEGFAASIELATGASIEKLQQVLRKGFEEIDGDKLIVSDINEAYKQELVWAAMLYGRNGKKIWSIQALLFNNIYRELVMNVGCDTSYVSESGENLHSSTMQSYYATFDAVLSREKREQLSGILRRELPDLCTAVEYEERLIKNATELVVSNGDVDLESVVNLDDMKNFENLEYLDVSGCVNLTDISAIKYMPKLKSLEIGACDSLRDISAVSELTNLTKIDMRYCAVSDLSPLAKLPKLRELLMSDCKEIHDLSPLKTLGNLEMLTLQNSGVAPAQVAEIRVALPNCHVYYEDVEE